MSIYRLKCAEMLTFLSSLRQFGCQHELGSSTIKRRIASSPISMSPQPNMVFQSAESQSSGLVRKLRPFAAVAVCSAMLIAYVPAARANSTTTTQEIYTGREVVNDSVWTATMRERIGPASPDAVDAFRSVGVNEISSKVLSDEEWGLVQRALSRLPKLHRCVLTNHLRRLSFLDLPPGLGSALVSRNEEENAEPSFDITLRASLLDQTLTEFLNEKEAHLFEGDGSGVQVRLDAGSTDALSYVLLHEATHILDEVLNISVSEGGFRSEAWLSEHDLAEPFVSSLAANTFFRRGPKIPQRTASNYYKALKKTPFVSFYSTASAFEDLAELVAWQQLAFQVDQSLTVTVQDKNGATQFEYAPLKQPLIQKRFRQLHEFLNDHKAACGNATAD